MAYIRTMTLLQKCCLKSLIFVIIFISGVEWATSTECTFYRGSVTFDRTCSSDCCETDCCEDKDYETIVIILGVVFGCLILIVLIIIVVVCCTKERWSKRISPNKSGSSRREKKNGVTLTEMQRIY